jgi:ubiquinone/menaquinone biosynthesis C-methylase UbiE
LAWLALIVFAPREFINPGTPVLSLPFDLCSGFISEQIMRSFVRAAFVALMMSTLSVVGQAFAADQSGYTNTGLSLDGIGKAYMGRNIAAVMGYQGASWLDRAERKAEERTDRLVALLELKPTDVVADIGAGSGYFSFRMSPLVAKVYAEDIQKEFLDMITARKAKGEGANVTPVLGGIVDPRLPANSIDLILLVDVYHEFSYPKEMGQAMVRALKPGGRIALVEYRAEDPKVPIKDIHKMTVTQAKKEMEALGLSLAKVDSKTLPWQHLMIFTKVP